MRANMRYFLTVILITGIVFNQNQTELHDFDSLWNYSDPVSTEKKFRELLTVAVESEDRSYRAELLTQIARTQGMQRNFEGAHKTLDMVEKMLTNDLVVANIRYLLERGRTTNSSGNREESIPIFLQAWDQSLSSGQDYWGVDVAHMLGIVMPPEKQLYWNGEAIKLAERSTDTRAKRWLGSLYNNTGWSYFELNDYVTAMGYFEKALLWHIERENTYQIQIARWTIARTYRATGKVEKALEIQHALEREISKLGDDPDGYVFEELAECYYLQNNKKEAQRYFILAYEHLSKDSWLQANELERLNRLKRMGE